MNTAKRMNKFNLDMATQSLSQSAVYSKISQLLKKSNHKSILEIMELVNKYNVREISPREMMRLAEELHKLGLVSDNAYLFMSFQPEMHPAFDATVGRHTGQTAEPDKKRDYIEIWENQVHNDKRSGSLNARKSDDVLKVLVNLQGLRAAA